MLVTDLLVLCFDEQRARQGQENKRLSVEKTVAADVAEEDLFVIGVGHRGI